MIVGIHHAAISTPDLDKALEFYCGTLGFQQIYVAGWPKGVPHLDALVGLEDSASKVAMIKLGATCVELFEYENPKGKPGDPKRPVNDHGYTHICLDVKDIAGEVKRLRAAGMPFHSDPVDTGPTLCAYGRDPFGNVIELQEWKDANDPMALPG
jgi:catechol 2,3-dioxygenase-like lactoylglutathione lyase family enzyme